VSTKGEKDKRKNYVWVKDARGNEFLCPADALRDPKDATEEVLEDCVDVEALKPYLDL
jgi:hypothetical protein